MGFLFKVLCVFGVHQCVQCGEWFFSVHRWHEFCSPQCIHDLEIQDLKDYPP